MPFLWLPVFTKMTSETHGARRSTEPLDLRDLIETIPALVLCALADGSAEFANRAWQEYSGRPLQELTGSGWQTTIHPDDIANLFHESTVALVSGKSIETEARLRRADGQYHWFSIRKTLAVSRSQNSEPSLRTLIACEDIEERKQEESARRYSEEQHRLVVETASDAVVSIDESSTILLANPATTRVFGYDPAELIGKPLTTLMPEFLRKLHEAGFKRYLATGQRHINWQGTELTGLRKNGQEFPVEVSFGELTKDGHRVFTGFLRDITERKRAEKKIRQSETYLAEAQRLSRTGSFGWNVSSGEIYWSEETYKIFEHYRAVKPTLELVFRRIHPDDRDRVQQALDRATNEKTDFDIEHRLLMPDGSVKHVHVLARALETSSGNLEYVGAVTDVTAAKQAEQKLRESEGYLAEAQRLSRTGSWAWAPGTGELRYWSEECFRVLGFDAQGGKPRVETFFQRIHPDDQAKVRETAERAGREKAEFEQDYRIVHPGGEIRDIHVVGHPVLSPSGDLVEFVGTVIDITERKRAEEELRTSEAHLAEAQRLSHTGSWVWEVAGRDAVHLSDEWYRIYAFDPSESMPTWEKRLERVHPEDRAKWQGALDRAIREKSDYEVEFRILLPDGSVKYIHTVGHPVVNASGDLVQFVGSSTDITERKQAEDKIRQSEMAL